MLSTLNLTARLSRCQGGFVAVVSQASNGYNNSSQCSPINTRRLHEEVNKTPDIQEYEPYSKLPYYHGKKGHLMYVGNMTKMVKGIKMFSISTSVVSIGSIPLIRSAIEESIMKAGAMGGISLLIFFTPFFLHFITKKYVTDIYFNSETEVYTLATKSLFLRRKEVQYYATDVEVPFVGGAFVTHRVKRKPVFIEREGFFNKDVYIKMVGYDKPQEKLPDWGNDLQETLEYLESRKLKPNEKLRHLRNEVADKTTDENKDKDGQNEFENNDKKFGLFNEKK